MGTLEIGENNTDNQHEGYGGYTITEIHDALLEGGILKENPNVALIHAGTNDLFWGTVLTEEPLEEAPDRLAVLVDAVLDAVPAAVVFVAQINHVGDYDNIDRFNAAVPGIVEARAAKGYKIQVVDFHTIEVRFTAVAAA